MALFPFLALKRLALPLPLISHLGTLARVETEQTLEHQSDVREHDMSDTLLKVIIFADREAKSLTVCMAAGQGVHFTLTVSSCCQCGLFFFVGENDAPVHQWGGAGTFRTGSECPC